MIKRFILVVMAQICIMATFSTIKQPDFAYPKTVIKESETQINAALKRHDDIQALRAFMDYALAQASISNDNINSTLSKLQSVRHHLTDTATIALIDLLNARILKSVYNNNRWKFDQRNLPLFPISDNVLEWSGAQFNQQISSLIRQAISYRDVLSKIRLADYSTIITVENSDAPYFPTVYDFVAYEAINSLHTEMSISPRLFCDATKFLSHPIVVLSSADTQLALEIFASLLRMHTSDTAAYIYADITRLSYLNANTFGGRVESRQNKYNELLWELYNKYNESEYSDLILNEIGSFISYEIHSQIDTKFYNAIVQHISRFPHSYFSNCLRNFKSTIDAKWSKFSVSNVVCPNIPFSVEIASHNSDFVELALYRLPETTWRKYQTRFDGSINIKINPSELKECARYKVEFNNTKPFFETKSKLITIPEPGAYILSFANNMQKTKNDLSQYTIIQCSGLSSYALLSENACVVAVNSIDGSPAENVTVTTFTSDYRRFTEKNNLTFVEGSTDINGLLTFPFKNNSDAISVSQNNDIYAKAYSFYNPIKQGFRYNTNDTTIKATFFTSLPIYHPGDTLDFAAVIYQSFKNKSELICKNDVCVFFRNANHETIDSVILATDNYGRISGRFIIPNGELTGEYSLSAKYKNTYAAYKWITVSDYKLPTYYSTITAVENNIPNIGDVTLSGVVRTYSGMSISSGNIKMTLSESTPWFWSNNSTQPFYSDSLSINPNGTFSLTIPKNVFEYSPNPANKSYYAKCIITASSGENAECSKYFSIGNSYYLSGELPEQINASTPTHFSSLQLKNGKGEKISTTLDVVISKSDSTTLKYSMNSLNPIVDLNHVEGGIYKIIIYAKSLECDTIIKDNVEIYKPTDKLPPVKMNLWHEKTNNPIPFNNEKNPQILIGTTEKTTHVLATLCSDSAIISQRWIAYPPGMHYFTVTDIPHTINNASLYLSSTLMGESRIIKYTFLRKGSVASIDISTSSFRDKIIPETTETWTFKVTNSKSSIHTAAVIAGMWSKAINNIKPLEWPKQFNIPATRRSIFAIAQQNSNTFENYFEYGNKLNRYSCNSIVAPCFRDYGMRFFGERRIYDKSTRVYKTISTSIGNIPVVEESNSAEMMDVAMAGQAPTLAFSSTETAGVEAEDSGAQDKSHSTNSVSIRGGDYPLAFFRPLEEIDSEGNYTLTFKVPNANTTWIYDMLAYDTTMISTGFIREIVANKPLMVQPNLPRFLRNGDLAEIRATVYNNSDSTAVITVTTDFFDPLNTKNLYSGDTIVSIAPQSSTTLSSIIKVPMTCLSMGYRVVARNSKFSDGEQQVINVLPSSQPVTESKAFYLDPDSLSYATTLPSYSENDILTLQYCENPLWYVVTALPGLSTVQPTSANQAVNNLFSATLASNIMTRYPEIARELKQFVDNPSDSMLVSQLQRNSELKRFLLQSTPWIMDAQSDTERMQRLALLLDKNNIDRAIAEAVDILSKLQTPSGGFKWMGWSTEPSLWSTEIVLEMLGQLNTMNILPGDKRLSPMISSALKYHQQMVEESYRKYPTLNYADYAIIRSLWPEYRPSLTGQKIINRYTQHLVGSWKKFDILGKCKAIEFLASKNYVSVSKSILASIKQFAEYSPEKGMWWPSLSDNFSGTDIELSIAAAALNAMHRLDPNDPDIDKVRQWLILQKELQNWGSSSTISRIAYSIISTSDMWKAPSSGAIISIGKEQYFVPSGGTGELKQNIKPSIASNAELSINRKNSTPAWGAIIAQRFLSMDSIRAVSSEAVSISKAIYKKRGKDWINCDTFCIGDVVKVSLLIKSSQALDYVTIDDNRGACFEPVDQLPGYIFSQGISFYRESKDASTNIYVSSLPKGVYVIEYEMFVNNAGEYSSGIASLQSQYQPAISAHSSSKHISVKP